MTSPASGTSRRVGTPGLDVFKIAGQSISGFVPSLKTSDARKIRQPFTSQLEERLALYLEYHPHVQFYQRGDASVAFAQAHQLVVPLGTPYPISYVYDGKAHDYLPDFIGKLSDGGLLIAEAGRDIEKRKSQALAKAEAAQRLAALKGGVYWIATEVQLSQKRHYNLLYLHNRRQTFSTYANIASQLATYWQWGVPQTDLPPESWSKTSVRILTLRGGPGHAEIDLHRRANYLCLAASRTGYHGQRGVPEPGHQ